MGILDEIESLKKGEVGKLVEERIREFEVNGKSKEDKVFSELCFCLMTANFSAEKCIKIQRGLGRGFGILPEEKLAEKLKEFGHRFWPQRANRIVEARSCKSELCEIMNPDGKKMREWLVKNVKGLGMKEASHFLRNIGYKDVAIIDFHILDLLKKEGFVEFDRKKETLTPRKYLEIEKILEEVGGKINLDLARLDLYLWYLETGKVLK